MTDLACSLKKSVPFCLSCPIIFRGMACERFIHFNTFLFQKEGIQLMNERAIERVYTVYLKWLIEFSITENSINITK